MDKGTPLKRLEVIGTDSNSCLKANHSSFLGRGTRDFILSRRHAILENKGFLVPEDWDTSWDISIGPIWTPERLGSSVVKCWLSPEYFHPWDPTSTETLVFQPPESSAVDRTITSSGSQSETSDTMNVGSHYDNRNRTVMVWDLSQIPSTSTISAATITLKHHSDNCSGDKTVQGFRLTQTGVNESCSWTTYDGSTGWTTDGGDYTETNGISQVIDCDTGSDFVDSSADLVALVQDAVDNQSGSLRIIFAAEEEIDGPESGAQRIKFHSSTAASSSNRPKISVTYIDPAKTAKLYQLDDRSGNGIEFQQNDSSEYLPDKSDLLNSFAGVSFNGSNEFSEDDSHSGDQEFDVGTDDFACALLIDVGTASGGEDFIISKGQSSTGWGISVDTNRSAKDIFFRIGADILTSSSSWSSANDIILVVCERSSSYSKIHVNGVLKATSGSVHNDDPDTSNNVLLGAVKTVSGKDSYWDGSIYEMVFLTGTLSSDNRENIEGYICHKFDKLDLLPTDHSYKTVPPRVNIKG